MHRREIAKYIFRSLELNFKRNKSTGCIKLQKLVSVGWINSRKPGHGNNLSIILCQLKFKFLFRIWLHFLIEFSAIAKNYAIRNVFLSFRLISWNLFPLSDMHNMHKMQKKERNRRQLQQQTTTNMRVTPMFKKKISCHKYKNHYIQFKCCFHASSLLFVDLIGAPEIDINVIKSPLIGKYFSIEWNCHTWKCIQKKGR